MRNTFAILYTICDDFFCIRIGCATDGHCLSDLITIKLIYN